MENYIGTRLSQARKTKKLTQEQCQASFHTTD